MRKLCLIILFFGFVSTEVSAASTPSDDQAVGLTCGRHANKLQILYYWVGPARYEQPEAKEWISVTNLATIDSRDKGDYWEPKRPTIRRCSIGGHTYTIEIAAHIFSANLMGQCGAEISASIRILEGKKELLPLTSFQNDCHSEEVVSEIVVSPPDSCIEIIMNDGNKSKIRLGR